MNRNKAITVMQRVELGLRSQLMTFDFALYVENSAENP